MLVSALGGVTFGAAVRLSAVVWLSVGSLWRCDPQWLGSVPLAVGLSAVVWPSCSVVRFYAAILSWPRWAGMQLARPSLRAALFVKVESLC